MPDFEPLSLLDEEYEDPYNSSSRFLNLFNRFGAQTDEEIPSLIDPNDPQFLEYQELSKKPTGSNELISSYINRRPTREQYHSDIERRKILGILFGGSIKSPEQAQTFIQRPYAEALQDWKLQGTNISNRARLLDTERGRQMQALRTSLQVKEKDARNRLSFEFRKEQENRRKASEVSREEERVRSQESLEEQRKFNRSMASVAQSLAKERLDLAKQRLEESKAKQGADLISKNKQLAAFASQHGIDDTNRTALQIADMLAAQKLGDRPEFSNYIKVDTEAPEGYVIETDDPKLEAIIRTHIKTLSRRYLQGNRLE